LLTTTNAPLSLPTKGDAFRKADREMVKKGYHVFPSIVPLNEIDAVIADLIAALYLAKQTEQVCDEKA